MVSLDNLGITFVEFTGYDGIVAVKLLFFANFVLVEVEHGFRFDDFPVFIVLQALNVTGGAVGQSPVQAGRRLEILLRFCKGSTAFLAGFVRIVLTVEHDLLLIHPDLFFVIEIAESLDVFLSDFSVFAKIVSKSQKNSVAFAAVFLNIHGSDLP